MAALHRAEIDVEAAHVGRRHHLQREPVVCIELLEGHREHGLDFRLQQTHLAHHAPQVVEALGIGLLQAHLQPRLAQRRGQLRQFLLDRRGAQQLEHLAQQLHVHRAHRQHAGAAAVEFGLFGFDAQAHLPDHVLVLATQAPEFLFLVRQLATPHRQHPFRILAHLAHHGRDGIRQHALPGAEHLVGQHLLESRNATLLEQFLVAAHLGQQALLGRQRDHLIGRDAQRVRGPGALAGDLLLDLPGRTQVVPHRVDLVEHHELGTVATVHGADVLAPDRQVRLGHAGIGRQDEHSALRLGDQAHRQFRLGADGVQARRVQHHQALLEQRMRHVDQRMAPARHFHIALVVERRVVFWRLVVPETEGTRLIHGHGPGFGNLLHRAGELLRIVHVQVDAGPFFRHLPPFQQGLGLQPRLDGQQAQAGRHRSVIAQFGRAHGGAAGAGRHDAAAVAGKEHRVDELRLAARELGHEGHHHLVGAQLLLQALHTLLGTVVQQFLVAHPVGQQLQAQGHFPAPGAVFVELCVESGSSHSGLHHAMAHITRGRHFSAPRIVLGVNQSTL